MRWTRRVVNFDRRIASWMGCYGHRLLRYSLAIIFIWFGLLKPLGMSPAADLVANTVYWFPPDVFVPILVLQRRLVMAYPVCTRAVLRS